MVICAIVFSRPY